MFVGVNQQLFRAFLVIGAVFIEAWTQELLVPGFSPTFAGVYGRKETIEFLETKPPPPLSSYEYS